jgi:bacterial polymer biosynthesis proteins, WecB/TagA/CpsF family
MNKLNTQRITFLNTYIDNLTATEAKHALEQLIQTDGNHYVVTPNTDIVVKMQEDPELKMACDQADLILTDGMILVKLSRYLGYPIKERIAMTDFVWDVFDLAIEKNYKVFLFGGKEGVLKKAAENVRKKLPELKLVGSYSPHFGFEKVPAQLEEANRRIKDSGADILIVFLGCPKQEKFILENKDNYRIPVSITMGGCVDFLAGEVKRAPLWMQKAGLEWFFRFLQEPRRMYKRYFVDDMKIFKMALEQKKRSRKNDNYKSAV